MALLRDELDDRLAVLGFLKDLVCLLELFQVLNLEEVVEADRGFELLTPGDSLQKATELLLALREELRSHFVIFDGKRWDEHVWELGLQDSSQGVKVSIFSADTPTVRLCRDRVKDVVRGEKAAFAHLRIDDFERDFAPIQRCRNNCGCRCP